MKFLSNHQLNKVAKSTLAMVIAGTFAFSTPLAFAAEETTESQPTQPIDLQNVTSTGENQTVDSNVRTDEGTQETEVTGDTKDETQEAETTEDAVKETENPEQTAEGTQEQVNDTQSETPSVVPGDFFYFAKIALEKVKLAFTFDDVKEAQLIATFAAERMAEAEALFKDGKEDEATKLLNKALEQFEDAANKVDDAAGDVNSEDGAQAADNKSDKVADSEASGTDDESVKDVEELISQNIIALQANMAKVKNPVAKAALNKNIEKSKAKLALKIDKFAEKETRKAKKDKKDKKASENEEPVVEVGTTNNTESQTETQNGDVTTEPTATPAPAATNESTVGVPVTQKETPAPAAKPQKVQVKEEIQQVRENAKQEVNQVRVEAKQEVKQIKDEAKQNGNQQHEAAKENGNSKENKED